MQILKNWLAMLITAALILSPVLSPPAAAGSIYYKGISPVAVEDDYDMYQHRGLMLNFSFGGPKNHKQRNSLQGEEVLKRDAKINKVGGFVLLAIAAGIFIAIEADDH